MRVLLLTQIVPYPPDSGPRVKTFHVLRHLAERGHQVTLASFVRSGEERHLEALRPYCSAIHAVSMRRSRTADLRSYVQSLSGHRPFLVTRDAKPEMIWLVRQLTQDEKFDVVHADQLTMGQFALVPDGARRVFDAHNAVWTIVERARRTAPLFLRPFLAQEARRLKAYEGALCRQMDAVLAVSDIDRLGLVEAGASADNIHVIPIAVDCDALPMARIPNDNGGRAEILTVGTLFYPPNADGVRWFIREVFPSVREQIRDVRLTIIGPRPPKDLIQFAQRNARAATVTGYVPDLRPYVERAALMVVPVRAASGMRVRILEALARGIPVVTTTTGVEGIDATDGEHLLLADEPASFAKAVVRLLQDPALGRFLAANGRRLIEQKYDWRVALRKLEFVYESLETS